MSEGEAKEPVAQEPEQEQAAEAEGDAKVEMTEEERAKRAAKNRAKKAKQKAKKQSEAVEAVLTPEDEEARRVELAKVMMPKRPQREDIVKKEHKFWDTQPVMQLSKPFEIGDDEGPLEQKKPADVQDEPYELPEGMEWWDPDVTKDEELDLVYELLRDHYVEDDDAMFRFNYSPEFLRWALLTPGYFPEWHMAIRSKSDPTQLAGFISGIPLKVRARASAVQMCEINFLCVNKNCRAKGLAPLLISEVTRRVNKRDIWQAIYTAGIVITSTIGQCQYWHRSLNPEKLIQINFSRIPPMFEKFARPMNQVKKHYALADQPKSPGMRQMVKKDHKQVRQLLETYLSKFGVHPMFTNEEICHWFLPRKDVIDTYVVQGEDGKLTNLCSFYTLPSTIIGGSKHKVLKAAYCYYNVPSEQISMNQLMEDAMILANKQGHDVFNALDIMDNNDIFKEQKFLIGDGHLRYYFYNWKFPELRPGNIGMVLL